MRLSSTLAAAVGAAALATSALAADVCNGDASLCTRLYSNVTYIGAHDSYAVGTSVADNQAKDVTAQLDDGIRALQVQVHLNGEELHLCHTSCSLKDGGTLQDYLSKVAAWLKSHPNDVVTLVMVNINNVQPAQYDAAFKAAGIDSYAYKPQQAATSVDAWPTLGTLIDAKTNLVVFMDNSADITSVPYIIDEFSNMWEDAYNVVDQTWGCAVNRSSGQSNSMMYMINHFLDVSNTIFGQQILTPNKDKMNETNAATGFGSIGFHVDNCNMLYGRNPNIILLDYYDSNGNAPFDAAAQMNGIAAPTTTVSPAPYLGSGSATASGTEGTTSVKVSSLSSALATAPAGSLAVLGTAVVGLFASVLVL